MSVASISLWWLGEQGAMVPVDQEATEEDSFCAFPDDDLETPLRLLGWLRFTITRQNVEVVWDRRRVASAALLAAAKRLSEIGNDFLPDRVRLRYTGGNGELAWTTENLPGAFEAAQRIKVLEATRTTDIFPSTTILPRSLDNIADEPTLLQHAFGAWRDDPTGQALFHNLSNRLIATSWNDDCLLLDSVGLESDCASAFGMDWARAAEGTPYLGSSDSVYDRRTANAYRSVSDRATPQLDHVDATWSLPDGSAQRAVYRRLLLPIPGGVITAARCVGGFDESTPAANGKPH